MINFIKKFSIFLQQHFLLSLLIVIVICIIINTIIFIFDDIENPHFNRNYNIINENGKDKKIYLSSPFIDATHFTFTTFSTVGYGDITPKTSIAKSWTNVMMFVVIVMTLKLFEYNSSNNSSCQADFKEFMLAKNTAEIWKKKINKTKNPSIATENPINKTENPSIATVNPNSILLNI